MQNKAVLPHRRVTVSLNAVFPWHTGTPGLVPARPFRPSLPFIWNLDSFTKFSRPQRTPCSESAAIPPPRCHMLWNSKSNRTFLPFPFSTTFPGLVPLPVGAHRQESRAGLRRSVLSHHNGNDGKVDKKHSPCSYKSLVG